MPFKNKKDELKWRRKYYLRVTQKKNAKRKKLLWQNRVDEGVESWQFLMRRFFTKKVRLQSYNQLKKDYEYFKKQGMQVAA